MHSKISALICVRSLKKGVYPKALWQAFETIFSPDDIVIYQPLILKEGQNVVFDILSLASGCIYRYDFNKDGFIFQEVSPDDDEGEELENALLFLQDIEECLSGDDLLNRLNFIEHRSKDKEEFETLCHFYRFLNGNAHYFKEKPKELTDVGGIKDGSSKRKEI